MKSYEARSNLSLSKKAGQAGLLLVARKGWGALVNVGVMAYLARTLQTSDFGLVAISATLISFIQTFSISGISDYIIFYREKNEKEIINSAFWLTIFSTGCLVIIALIIAPFWSKIYNDERIVNIVILLLIGFSFSMLASIPNALYRKRMNYKPMVTALTIFGTLTQLSQVLFVFLGYGVYSLALPNAIIQPLLAFVLFWNSEFRPSFKQFGLKYWRQIFSYTKHVIGTRILGKFINEGDTLLIGGLLGMTALGIYDIAFKLANILNIQILPIITNITMPIFAKNKESISVVREHFDKMINLISFIFIPVFGGFIAFAPFIVTFLYGNRWIDAIIPFQILCMFAAIRSLSSPTSGLYNALGRPQIGLYFNSIFAPVFLLTIYMSSLYGLLCACIFVTVARILGSSYHFYKASKLLHFQLLDFWNIIYAPLIVTSFSVTLIVLLPMSSFTVSVIIYLLTYMLFMLLFFRQKLVISIGLIQKLIPIKLV